MSKTSAGATAAAATVLLVSSRERPATDGLLANVRAQNFPRAVELVVVRTEQIDAVTRATERHGATCVTPADGALVARSSLDHALASCDAELVVVVAADLELDGGGWLDSLLTPMLTDPRVQAVRGKVLPALDLPPYDQLRFEQQRSEPLDLLAFRRSAWERHPFHKSANLGHRWLERVEADGAVRVADAARGYGRVQIPLSTIAIARATFCNLPLSVTEGARSLFRETLEDWDALRKRKLERPLPSYLRAAQVRLGENLGRTRLKRLLGD